jgi:TolB-like protein
VLPFTNRAAGPANRYFADGLTAEITDSLVRLKTLRAIALSSVFQFRGKPVDIRQAGRLPHIDNPLEGSAERAAGGIPAAKPTPNAEARDGPGLGIVRSRNVPGRR